MQSVEETFNTVNAPSNFLSKKESHSHNMKIEGGWIRLVEEK
jgi:hypothetical protein